MQTQFGLACTVCGKLTTRTCPRCERFAYCSQSCQDSRTHVCEDKTQRVGDQLLPTRNALHWYQTKHLVQLRKQKDFSKIVVVQADDDKVQCQFRSLPEM